MIARDIGRLPISVAVEVGEHARLLLDHVDPNALVVFEMSTELITIVDFGILHNLGGDIRLVSRHLAFGVNSVAGHTTRYETDRGNIRVVSYYPVTKERFRRRRARRVL